MIWGVSFLVLLTAMGAALDYSLLTNAKARAQSVADTTALAAAIYVRDNEVVPTNRQQGLIGDYTAGELGYKFRDWVIEGSEGVNINVAYDLDKREAVVTATGKTRPMLMQILGYDELDFSSQTVVKFEQKQPLDPASIVLIMDNSGSMEFDDKPLVNGNAPLDATVRMDGLIASAKAFMTNLDETVGPQDGSTSGPRVLRTGMMAFDSAIIPARTVEMEWGTEWATGPEDKLELMEPLRATNSAPPLEEAFKWLTGTGSNREPAIHKAENPQANPLKYVILMTDGKNTIGDPVWVPRAGTQTWRAFVTSEPTTERRVVNRFVPNGNCAWQGTYPYGYYYYHGSWGFTRRYYTNRRVVCDVTTEGTTTEEIRHQTNEPNEPGNWEEGEYDISSNIETRKQCDDLHAAGVEVFAIGFALVPGQFETNAWANRTGGFTPYPPNETIAPHDAYSYEESVKDTNIAKGLLQYCASKDENFITADDTSALQAAFQRIGNTIVKEIIRIDS